MCLDEAARYQPASVMQARQYSTETLEIPPTNVYHWQYYYHYRYFQSVLNWQHFLTSYLQ